MKRKQLPLSLGVALCVALLSSCAISPSKTVARLAARPVSPVELKNDSIQIAAAIRFLPKSLDKKSVAKITPVLKYGPNMGQKASLDPIYVKGGSSPLANASKTIQTKTGGSVQYITALPYDTAMRESYLYVQISVTRGNVTADTLLPVAPGAITTVELMQAEPQLIFTEEYDAVQAVDRQAEFFYKIGTEKFDPAFMDKSRNISNQEQVQKLIQYLDNNSHLLQSVSVSSYASPDGNEAKNEMLASRRASGTIQYIRAYMKRKGFAEVEEAHFFLKTATSEDWNQFETQLAASTIKDKEAILQLIRTAPKKDDALEKEIARKYPKAYQEIKNTIFVKLRRAEVKLVLVKEIEKEEQLVGLLQNTEKFSSNDFIFFGANAKGTENKMRIYEAFQEKYPAEWRGYNNIGCVLVQEGRYEEARKYFEKALANSPGNEKVTNNIGVTYLMEKNYGTAEDWFKKAHSSKLNTYANQGYTYLRRGNYEEAASSYRKSGKCSYNYALSLLLNNNNSEAKTQLNCLGENADSAKVAYLKAIIGVRMEETAFWQEQLKLAISLDPGMKQRALSDIEFASVRETAEFRQMLEQ